MEKIDHTLPALFKQLGLPDTDEDIESFIEAHRPLEDSVHIEDATFWTLPQKHFLAGRFEEDAEWVSVIDDLSVRLRE